MIDKGKWFFTAADDGFTNAYMNIKTQCGNAVFTGKEARDLYSFFTKPCNLTANELLENFDDLTNKKPIKKILMTYKKRIEKILECRQKELHLLEDQIADLEKLLGYGE